MVAAATVQERFGRGVVDGGMSATSSEVMRVIVLAQETTAQAIIGD
jgi:hypothetical protein